MNGGGFYVPASFGKNDAPTCGASRASFARRVATFGGKPRKPWGCGGASLPDVSASDAPPAARDIGRDTSDVAPLFPRLRSSAREGERELRHAHLPPPILKPCAAAARSPEHRLAVGRVGQVGWCRSPREGRGTCAGERRLRPAWWKVGGAVPSTFVVRGWRGLGDCFPSL